MVSEEAAEALCFGLKKGIRIKKKFIGIGLSDFIEMSLNTIFLAILYDKKSILELSFHTGLSV